MTASNDNDNVLLGVVLAVPAVSVVFRGRLASSFKVLVLVEENNRRRLLGRDGGLEEKASTEVGEDDAAAAVMAAQPMVASLRDFGSGEPFLAKYLDLVGGRVLLLLLLDPCVNVVVIVSNESFWTPFLILGTVRIRRGQDILGVSRSRISNTIKMCENNTSVRPS